MQLRTKKTTYLAFRPIAPLVKKLGEHRFVDEDRTALINRLIRRFLLEQPPMEPLPELPKENSIAFMPEPIAFDLLRSMSPGSPQKAIQQVLWSTVQLPVREAIDIDGVVTLLNQSGVLPGEDYSLAEIVKVLCDWNSRSQVNALILEGERMGVFELCDRRNGQEVVNLGGKGKRQASIFKITNQ